MAGLILEGSSLIASLPHLCCHMCACTDVHTCINKRQLKCFYSTRILITLDAVSHNSVIQKIAVEAWMMSVPHSLRHLNARFSVGDPVWGGFWGTDLWKKCIPGGGLWGSGARAILGSFPLLSACDGDVNSLLSTFFFICYVFLLPSSAPLMLIYSALRSHKHKANPSFHNVPWLLFYRNNRKVTVILYFVFIKVIIDAQICISVPIKSY